MPKREEEELKRAVKKEYPNYPLTRRKKIVYAILAKQAKKRKKRR